MGHDAEFHLGIVCGQEDPGAVLVGLAWDKALAQLAPPFGPHGDVLQVGVGGSQASRGCGDLAEGTVDAAGIWVYAAGQGVHVGVLELGKFTPTEESLDDFHIPVGLGQGVVVGGVPGLGLAHPFDPGIVLDAEFLEQHPAKGLGAARIQVGCLGQLLDLAQEDFDFLFQSLGHGFDFGHVEPDTPSLHCHKYAYKGHFQVIEKGAVATLVDLRGQLCIKSEGHIRVFAGVLRHLIHHDFGHGDLILALADDRAGWDLLQAEVGKCQAVQVVPSGGARHCEAGHHGVEVGGREIDSLCAEDQGVVLPVLGHGLQVAIFQQGAQGIKQGFGSSGKNLRAGIEWHIKGASRLGAEGGAYQGDLKSFQAGGFGVEGKGLRCAQLIEHGLEVISIAHGDVVQIDGLPFCVFAQLLSHVAEVQCLEDAL